MRGIERRMSIMKMLQERGHVEISELSQLFDVSTMTIRRDLGKLQDEGFVIVEYGGASLRESTMFEYSIPMKQEENQKEKSSIAHVAASFIKEGDTIFLDAGTTTCEVAKEIASRKNIRVMTHSLLVANVLANSDLEFIMCPGAFRLKSMAFMGQLTDRFISSFRFDYLFLGVDGVSLENGVSVPDITDGITKQNLIRQARKTICLADSSKFGKTFHCNICNISDIHMLITDSGLPDDQLILFKKETDLVTAE